MRVENLSLKNTLDHLASYKGISPLSKLIYLRLKVEEPERDGFVRFDKDDWRDRMQCHHCSISIIEKSIKALEDNGLIDRNYREYNRLYVKVNESIPDNVYLNFTASFVGICNDKSPAEFIILKNILSDCRIHHWSQQGLYVKQYLEDNDHIVHQLQQGDAIHFKGKIQIINRRKYIHSPADIKRVNKGESI